MKMILFNLALCAIVTTATAKNPVINTHSDKDSLEKVIKADYNIAENISALKAASIFARSILVSDLTQTFDNPGPLTIFLPTDDAFNKLPKGKLDSLLTPMDKYQLVAFVTYYAVPGNLSAKTIAKNIRKGKGLATFKTLSGAVLKAQFDPAGEIVMIDESNRKCSLKQTDLKQKNGVIHIVSDVMIPRFKAI
jgi:uncharacterized surface protein with fasciclin (FAS1) repeats